MTVLVTGATGFVGNQLLHLLANRSVYPLRGAVRAKAVNLPAGVSACRVGDINANTDWHEALADCKTVIHTAARAHIMNDSAQDPLIEFRRVNVEGTLTLARQAIEAGVNRFIFISSIKVNGEGMANQAYRFDDPPSPEDGYGLSKWEAEQGLSALCSENAMELVIIRPPLVYGPGVKANFASMMKWVHKSIPLPFGSVHNKRSLVALDNLVSFIIHCIDHPKAANEIFLISDGEDVSTTELLQKAANALGKKSLLIPVPVTLMKLLAKLLGKADVADRLFCSLQVDSTKARDLLGWKPVISMDDELKKTADAYLICQSEPDAE